MYRREEEDQKARAEHCLREEDPPARLREEFQKAGIRLRLTAARRALTVQRVPSARPCIDCAEGSASRALTVQRVPLVVH